MNTDDPKVQADAARPGQGEVKLKGNEYMYILNGAGSLLTNTRGEMRVFSELFQYDGYTWQLDIDSQKLARFGQTNIPAKALCVYLTLRDAAIIAPEDMPYIRCSMTVINHANRDNDIKQVMQRQYRNGLNATGVLWSWAAVTVRHTHLEEMKEEVMPEGDLHLLLRFERVLPAKDCASRSGCSVAEHLVKSTPEKLDKKPETEKEIGRERAAAEWLCGGSKDVSEGAKAVRDAVKGNPALCRRMRAARRLSLYGGPQADDDFNAVLCVLRNTLECKAATEALLAHFGGDKPHTAVAACLAADPAGLLRHIGASVGPQHASRGEGKTTTRTPAARRGLRALLCGA